MWNKFIHSFNEAKEDYPGLIRSTLTASSYNTDLENASFSYVWALATKEMAVAKNPVPANIVFLVLIYDW